MPMRAITPTINLQSSVAPRYVEGILPGVMASREHPAARSRRRRARATASRLLGVSMQLQGATESVRSRIGHRRTRRYTQGVT